MTTAIGFDPASGTLVADDAALSALRRPDASELLAAAGALDDDGGPTPPMRAALDALDAVEDPDTSTLLLTSRGRSAEVRVARAVAVLRMPAGDDGRRMVVHLAPSLVPDALARAVDLGPRPAPPRTPTDTDRLVADHEVTRWWTLGAPGSVALEVVDTPDGLWLVEPGPTGAGTARPARPAEVWRRITRIVAGARPGS